ncbi:MAG: hypothetical protein M1828_000992 [Chrysothrix sp. TS-e1954]|nr:MAG: hypothetical protein M1828_000992 [Chrysothrix sp. TS-e1954]
MPSEGSSTSLILAINAGSSSVKASLYESGASVEQDVDPRQLAEIQIGSISAPPATLKYTRYAERVESKESTDNVDDQEKAFRFILNLFVNDKSLPELSHIKDIHYVCHRIVHGGEYGKVQVIDQSTYHRLEELSDLAPLHNTVGLTIVRAVHHEMPDATNMAYFDSAFHSTIPDHIRSYAIDPEKARRNGLRKYGFHGISYAFIVKATAQYLGKAVEDTNVIALHLGSGASACAIRSGKSLDTSYAETKGRQKNVAYFEQNGFDPSCRVAGSLVADCIEFNVPLHTRCWKAKSKQHEAAAHNGEQAEEILNKQSGFKALAGTSDFGKMSASSSPECKLAVDLFVDRVLGFVGSYYLKLGGRVDALVFAGGIGENVVTLRERVVDQAECLGFALDAGKNAAPENAVVADIGASTASHKTLVCQTDEQLEMARGCQKEANTTTYQSK